MSSPSIVIVAGEPSGDKHASAVIRELKKLFPQSKMWGIGGPLMQKEGFDSILPFGPFNRMGFLEVVSHLSFFLQAKSKLVKMMRDSKPDCLICVDYPGFNMPLMKNAFKMGIPVLWYIAPMVWAWKKKRAKTMAKYASHIGCIFPFEVDYFKPFTENVSFVGNPLVEQLYYKKEKNNVKEPVIAIIPGSRKQEVEKILNPMTQSYKILKQKFPSLRGIVSHCNTLPDSMFDDITKGGEDLELFSGPLHELLSRADLALVTSGTATLETALLGVPMVIVYRTSLVSYLIYKTLVKIPYIGLPNIIAGKKIVPECIQNEANPQEIADLLGEFLNNKRLFTQTVENLEGIRSILGFYKPSVKIAQIAKILLKRGQSV